jgi:Protein of unknown function (DUF3352)
VTVPPYDNPNPSASGRPGPGAPGWPPAEPPAGRRSRRRGVVIGAVVGGVLLLGGAGFATASYLSGGGTQPEDVMPADVLAFVKVDLDPAAGQKMALGSLLEKFPDVDTEGDGDIRDQLLQPLLELSGDELDYSADVEPWLGDRMAVAAVPAEDSPAGVVPVVALAVSDEERMTEALRRAQDGAEFGFAVRDDFVLITDTQERADGIAAAEQTLADDADFSGDRDALGGDQVAIGWADLSAAEGILESQAAAQGVPADAFGGADLAGRVILGVHAQDDALEMVGMDFGVSDVGVPSGEPTRLAQDLPEDTLAALAASGAGDSAVAAWSQLEESGALAEMTQPLAELGLDLPDDLRAMLGSDLVVAVSGQLESPALGARVVTEQPEAGAGALDALLGSLGVGGAPVYSFGAGDYVVATDAATADALAADGGLGDTDAFRAAVADPDHASAIGFVDLATVLDQVVAQGGEAGEEAAKFSAVEALGLSVSGTDEGSRFVLRITTR